MSEVTCLVGDIGGTNARFAIARQTPNGFVLSDRIALSARDYPQFDDALAKANEASGMKPDRASFVVAGPISDGRVKFTNSRWEIDARAIGAGFGFSGVRLENDFAGQARGALHVARGDVKSILPGKAHAGAPIAVLGPGTGLGLAFVVPAPDGSAHILSTEGGHTAFAPQTNFEATVLAHLQKSHQGYASFERVASGLGITSVYDAIRAMAGLDPVELDAAVIAARANQDEHAAQTMAMFFAALGVFAGNAVLMGGARGGVMLGGGILPKLQAELDASKFAARFRTRGPMSDYLADCPVDLILSDETALLGAAAFGFS